MRLHVRSPDGNAYMFTPPFLVELLTRSWPKGREPGFGGIYDASASLVRWRYGIS